VHVGESGLLDFRRLPAVATEALVFTQCASIEISRRMTIHAAGLIRAGICVAVGIGRSMAGFTAECCDINVGEEKKALVVPPRFSVTCRM
jgi:hypothetical protein